jgi:hypothetical protein
MMPPAVAAITLGLVTQTGYAHQLGRNEAFNHAGNVTAALLAGFFGYLFGLGSVFAVMAAACECRWGVPGATVGGIVAEHLGYAAAFLVLAGIAVLAPALWVVARPITAGACGDASAHLQASQASP